MTSHLTQSKIQQTRDRNIFNLIKASTKPTANVILNGEGQNGFPPMSRTVKCIETESSSVVVHAERGGQGSRNRQ